MLAKDIYDLSIDSPNPGACTTWGFFTVFTTAIDAQAVAVLFFDRLTFLSNPMSYACRMTKTVVVFLVSFNILQGLIVALAPKTSWGKYDVVEGVRTCAISWRSHKSFLVFFVVWTYVIPLAACSVCFARALSMIKHRMCQVTLPVLNQPQRMIYSNKTSLGIDGSLRSTARILFIIYVLFLISWLPFCLMQIIYVFVPPAQKTVTSSYHVLRTFTFIGSTINPWLYGLYNRRFRQTMKSVILCLSDHTSETREPSVVQISRTTSVPDTEPVSLARRRQASRHGSRRVNPRSRSVSVMGLYNFPMELSPREEEWSVHDPRIFKPRASSIHRPSVYLETDMIRLSIPN